jgi:hypothetical protein
MIERRRSVKELLTMVERMRSNLLQIDGTDKDILNWIELQNDASRIDVEAAARRREHQERSH